jgi:hypothetical protein
VATNHGRQVVGLSRVRRDFPKHSFCLSDQRRWEGDVVLDVVLVGMKNEMAVEGEFR